MGTSPQNVSRWTSHRLMPRIREEFRKPLAAALQVAPDCLEHVAALFKPDTDEPPTSPNFVTALENKLGESFTKTFTGRDVWAGLDRRVPLTPQMRTYFYNCIEAMVNRRRIELLKFLEPERDYLKKIGEVISDDSLVAAATPAPADASSAHPPAAIPPPTPNPKPVPAPAAVPSPAADPKPTPPGGRKPGRPKG